jgi:acyl carrier protein
MDKRAQNVDRTKQILKEALQLGKRADALSEKSALLGALPELDSMAVVTVLTLIEEKLGVVVADDEVSADVFQTVGTLTDFVERVAGA